jgi:hypothetical protein
VVVGLSGGHFILWNGSQLFSEELDRRVVPLKIVFDEAGG